MKKLRPSASGEDGGRSIQIKLRLVQATAKAAEATGPAVALPRRTAAPAVVMFDENAGDSAGRCALDATGLLLEL